MEGLFAGTRWSHFSNPVSPLCRKHRLAYPDVYTRQPNLAVCSPPCPGLGQRQEKAQPPSTGAEPLLCQAPGLGPRASWKPKLKFLPQSSAEGKPRSKGHPGHLKRHVFSGAQTSTSAAAALWWEKQMGRAVSILSTTSGSGRRTCPGDEQSPGVMAGPVQKQAAMCQERRAWHRGEGCAGHEQHLPLTPFSLEEGLRGPGHVVDHLIERLEVPKHLLRRLVHGHRVNDLGRHAASNGHR